MISTIMTTRRKSLHNSSSNLHRLYIQSFEYQHGTITYCTVNYALLFLSAEYGSFWGIAVFHWDEELNFSETTKEEGSENENCLGRNQPQKLDSFCGLCNFYLKLMVLASMYDLGHNLLLNSFVYFTFMVIGFVSLKQSWFQMITCFKNYSKPIYE